ncbi:MFS transporter [Lentilactobacillus buchneri]|uniref:MFS transporter n=1 Tax=Lentilactobacillus buchneri TaxID=1581 RepID=UPI001290A0EB|nr:MFS transporter [Lentilactobacillus buchneri]MQM78540.1 MFS transporter [Lentilactobacillus buchneri]MQM88589.1 MFS transporter [Lentilactobacillus buchneri]MQN23051.1 MFS transporter [Lentilactobacillus buchneri]
MARQANQQNQWWIFTAVVLLSFMSTLTSSIVNIALPVMSRAMAVPTAQVTWVASSYLIVTCMFLLPFGKLGDMLGKARVFKIGTVIFTIASLFCGINLGFVWILIMRGIQALGASMTLSTNAGIITETFSKEQRGLALGSFGSVVALGSIAGPGLGGLILTYLPWNYIFWVNVPVGIAAIILGQIVLPKAEATTAGKIDAWGMLVLIFMAGSLFMGLILGQQVGFMSLIFLSLMIATIILLIIFIYLEKRAADPVMNFHLFSNIDFSLSLLATILVYGINFVVNIIEPIYLEQNRFITTDLAGLILISFPIIQIIVSPFAGWLSDRFGSHRIAAISLAMLIISQAGLASVNHTTPLLILCLWLGFVGLGNGLFQAPTNVLVMNSVSKDQLGVASGLLGFSRNTGMTVGAIFANILLFTGISMNLGHSTIDYPVAQPEAFIFGMRFTFWITTAIFVLLFIVQVAVNFKRKNT